MIQVKKLWNPMRLSDFAETAAGRAIFGA